MSVGSLAIFLMIGVFVHHSRASTVQCYGCLTKPGGYCDDPFDYRRAERIDCNMDRTRCGLLHRTIFFRSKNLTLSSPRNAPQSAVMLQEVVRPSVYPSICDVRAPSLHRLEFFENKIHMFKRTRSPPNAKGSCCLWLAYLVDNRGHSTS